MTYNSQQGRNTLIWQWNCRSLKRKKADFRCHIQNAGQQPDIILIQEAHGCHTIPDYTTFSSPSITHTKRRTQQSTTPVLTLTLVHNSIPAIQIDTSEWNTDTQETVAVQCQPTSTMAPLTVINTYWKPGRDIGSVDWVKRVAHDHKHSHLVVAGDFNSRHTAWGYTDSSPRGRKLQGVTTQAKLTLLNDILQPTRIGNSVERNTMPDLAWTNQPKYAQWYNTQENLASDHHIVAIELAPLRPKPCSRRTKFQMGTIALTDWNKVRTLLQESEPPVNQEEWSKQIQQAVRKHTTELTTTREQPTVDSHLLALWDRRLSLRKKLHTNKHSKKLRRKLQELSDEIQKYSQQLINDKWVQFCDSMNGRVHTSNVWRILNILLGNKKTSPTIQKLKLRTKMTNDDLAELLLDHFSPTPLQCLLTSTRRRHSHNHQLRTLISHSQFMNCKMPYKASEEIQLLDQTKLRIKCCRTYHTTT